MNKVAYNTIIVISILVILWLIITAMPVAVYGQTVDREPEVVEIVTIYDVEGNRGTATITHVRATFSIEVVLPDGEVVEVKNWRTAKYDLNDIISVSDKIHCAGEYFPPKYFGHKITRKIFLKATR